MKDIRIWRLLKFDWLNFINKETKFWGLKLFFGFLETHKISKFGFLIHEIKPLELTIFRFQFGSLLSNYYCTLVYQSSLGRCEPARHSSKMGTSKKYATTTQQFWPRPHFNGFSIWWLYNDEGNTTGKTHFKGFIVK